MTRSPPQRDRKLINKKTTMRAVDLEGGVKASPLRKRRKKSQWSLPLSVGLVSQIKCFVDFLQPPFLIVQLYFSFFAFSCTTHSNHIFTPHPCSERALSFRLLRLGGKTIFGLEIKWPAEETKHGPAHTLHIRSDG